MTEDMIGRHCGDGAAGEPLAAERLRRMIVVTSV
jgi:hypothetical protein